MKVYIVRHYTVLDMSDEDGPKFELSDIVCFVAATLTDAVCYMEKHEANSDDYWWKVDLFEVGKDYYDDEDMEDNGEHVGWYDRSVVKMECSMYQEVLARLTSSSQDEDFKIDRDGGEYDIWN